MRSLLCLVFLAGALARKGFGPGEQEWGHVEVRKGAHLFYWFHYGQRNGTQPEEMPTILWLPGGPGGASTVSAFNLGLIDKSQNPNNETWMNYANMLYVDSPVGVGFSYVEEKSLLVTDNTQLGKDVVTLLKNFYTSYPTMRKSPLYIMGVSYGGTSAAVVGKHLNDAIEAKEIAVKLAGISMWHPSISTAENELALPKAWFEFGYIDQDEYVVAQAQAEVLAHFLKEENYKSAAKAASALGQTLDQASQFKYPNVNDAREKFEVNEKPFLSGSNRDEFMEKEVGLALSLNDSLEYHFFSREVHNAMGYGLLHPVTSEMEELLNFTSAQVSVLSGQFDLNVITSGLVKSVDNLQWPGSSRWRLADRNPLVIENYLEGYYKETERLKFIWINRSGHDSEDDWPNAHFKIMKYLLGYEQLEEGEENSTTEE